MNSVTAHLTNTADCAESKINKSIRDVRNSNRFESTFPSLQNSVDHLCRRRHRRPTAWFTTLWSVVQSYASRVVEEDWRTDTGSTARGKFRTGAESLQRPVRRCRNVSMSSRQRPHDDCRQIARTHR